MRWKLKTIYKARYGERRIVQKFAWFPTKVQCKFPMNDSSYLIWLEWYSQEQEFVECYTHAPDIGIVSEDRWCKVQNYIKK